MFLSTSVNRSPFRRRALLLAAACIGTLLIPAVARAERSVVITGGGYGHGIGMSQYGAYGRALNGKSATQILEHYYTGTQVAERSITKGLRVGLLPAYGSSRSSFSFTSLPGASPGGDIGLKVKGAREHLARGTKDDVFRVAATATGGINVFKNGELVRKDGVTSFGDPTHPVLVNYAGQGSVLRVLDKSQNYVYGKMAIGTYSSSSCGTYCIRLVLIIPDAEVPLWSRRGPLELAPGRPPSSGDSGPDLRAREADQVSQPDPCGCAVYDSTIDQAYVGDGKRVGSGSYWDEWKKAVEVTNGRVITSGGNLIQPLYSSSSGGHTENNENVWGGVPIPYLRGVPDSPDKAEGANPNFKWTVTMTWSDFEARLNSAFGTGSLRDFDLLRPFGVSGRVTAVKDSDSGGARIVGSADTERAGGWTLRGVLGLKDTLFRGPRLRGRWGFHGQVRVSRGRSRACHQSLLLGT